HGIKCYQCVSENSWDDCVPGNDTTCSNSTGSCLQLEFDGDVPGIGTYRVFQRECTMKSVCNQDICKRFRQASSTVRKCVAGDIMYLLGRTKLSRITSFQRIHYEKTNEDSASFRNSFVIVISLFFVGHGIKCYRCVSAKSWDDCDPGNVTTCSNSSSCLQFEVDAEFSNHGTYRLFQRECTMKSVCNDDICKRYRQVSPTVRKCGFACCESDLCN
ncbi:unnamed protein product, partial [Porites evermanni]